MAYVAWGLQFGRQNEHHPSECTPCWPQFVDCAGGPAALFMPQQHACGRL